MMDTLNIDYYIIWTDFVKVSSYRMKETKSVCRALVQILYTCVKVSPQSDSAQVENISTFLSFGME